MPKPMKPLTEEQFWTTVTSVIEQQYNEACEAEHDDARAARLKACLDRIRTKREADVIIELDGGIPSVVKAHPDASIEIRDYDTDGSYPDRTEMDPTRHDGDPFFVYFWKGGETDE